jgi:2-polyprenyl-3-methyl-5-hydroxy-6-metoxy-1,4-benzoquinol methylase
MHKCPVCDSGNASPVGEVSRTAITDYYRTSLSMDVSSLLAQDSAPIKLLNCKSCDLKWYQPAPSGDPAFYEGLQKHQWYYQDEKPEYAYASQHLKSGDKLLEVGCGKGAFAAFLPKGIAYRGLEFNQDAVTKGRAQGLQIDIEAVEDHAARYPATYDAVCHFQVLEHVTDPLAFLKACAALIRPGGLLVVAVPSEDSFLSIVENGFLNMPPHHLTRWSDKALGFAINRVGLSPVAYWHEAVAEYHRQWYATTLSMFALRGILGQKTNLQTHDFLSRVLRRLVRNNTASKVLSKMGSDRFPLAPNGHTVCVVGQKPKGAP